MRPTFTVLIGSAGRPSLAQTLESIARQGMVEGDQVIVAFDALDRSSSDLEQDVNLVASFGKGFEACAYNSGYHWYGVEQINYAMRMLPLTGSHVFTLGDDDVFVDGAWDKLRPLCAENMLRPILYKFLTPPYTPQGAPWRHIYWEEPKMVLGRISGCCIAAPARFVRPLPTARIVEHDFVWMEAILALAPEPLWLDELLVIARPDEVAA